MVWRARRLGPPPEPSYKTSASSLTCFARNFKGTHNRRREVKTVDFNTYFLLHCYIVARPKPLKTKAITSIYLFPPISYWQLLPGIQRYAFPIIEYRRLLIHIDSLHTCYQTLRQMTISIITRFALLHHDTIWVDTGLDLNQHKSSFTFFRSRLL